jgi:hypothetical protein
LGVLGKDVSKDAGSTVYAVVVDSLLFTILSRGVTEMPDKVLSNGVVRDAQLRAHVNIRRVGQLLNKLLGRRPISTSLGFLPSTHGARDRNA